VARVPAAEVGAKGRKDVLGIAERLASNGEPA
jgi:hypothetical protein